MQQLEQKYIKVRNGRTGVERLIPTNGMQHIHLLADEYEVPHSLKDKWMMEKVANLIKERELAAIKFRLENMDDWAIQVAQQIPAFSLAEMGKSKYPNLMSYEEVNKFRSAHIDALAFYATAIQYLERGHSPEEVQKLMEERHPQACGRDGVQAAFADHTAKNKALLELV